MTYTLKSMVTEIAGTDDGIDYRNIRRVLRAAMVATGDHALRTSWSWASPADPGAKTAHTVVRAYLVRIGRVKSAPTVTTTPTLTPTATVTKPKSPRPASKPKSATTTAPKSTAVAA